MSEQNNGSFFNNASPKLTFVFGLVAGLAVVSFIGFIILLTGKFRGGNDRAIADTGSPVVQAPAPVPSAGSEDRVGPFRQIDTAKDHIRGDKNARVSIIEYSDLECPFCKSFHQTLRDTLASYAGKMRLVYRHFPIVQLHSKAPKEAEATECAAELGGNDAFWKYVDRLFAVTPSNDGLDLAELPKIASAIGLNQKKFETCLSSGKYAAKVLEDKNDAESAGAYQQRLGTPFSVIVAGDQAIPVPGAVPAVELKQILDQVTN